MQTTWIRSSYFCNISLLANDVWKICLEVPALDKFSALADNIVPGHIICGDGDIVINRGRNAVILSVTNTGDRPVQVLHC